VPGKTIIEIPVEEQAEMLRELRAVRYGYCWDTDPALSAAGYSPTEIASVLFCSRQLSIVQWRATAAVSCGSE